MCGTMKERVYLENLGIYEEGILKLILNGFQERKLE
jgi:hypothetical protein